MSVEVADVVVSEVLFKLNNRLCAIPDIID